MRDSPEWQRSQQPKRQPGFNTPSFNSAQSISNGIEEPAGDTFARDQQVYEQNESVANGLGPVYNATSCVSCHQNPNSGAASQITELRVGHNDENGNFVNPTIFINDGKDVITGRSIVNDRAIGPEAPARWGRIANSSLSLYWTWLSASAPTRPSSA